MASDVAAGRTVEGIVERVRWIFRYFYGDGKEVDLGPYMTWGTARAARDYVANYGTRCSPPVRVSESYQLRRGED